MQTQTILFFGPQGSGKGTQAANVIAHLNETDDKPVVDLETGRGFRAMREQDTYAAERVKEILANGELVPNFLTSSIVMNELVERMTMDSHLVIDGFPRNLDQARVLEQMFQFFDRSNLTVVCLDVDDATVIERMQERGRDDDTPGLIAERLRLYHDQTKPLLEHFEARPNTNFLHIDGAQTIDEVWSTIKSKIS